MARRYYMFDLLRYFGVAALTVFILPAFSQTVDFHNGRNFAVVADRLVRDVNGEPLVGANYLGQLYFGAEGSPSSSLLPVLAPPVNFGTFSPGVWAGGGMRTLTGFSEADIVTLQVRAWDSTGGLSLEAAKALGREWGESATFTYYIPSVGPVELWWIEEFRGFSLVPEPSVVILGVAGAFVVLALTRRRTRLR
jgi:hypothetical protein